ncbi:MAG: hypothetical protein J0M18_00570 [Ignavibacteria bacterium]|nr:hypothetical protein [Ignavibacteria bacterium]
MQSVIEYNGDYNLLSNNCSNFAKTGLEEALGKVLNATENIGGQEVVNPSKLFKSAMEEKNSLVIRDPGDAVNQTYKDRLFDRTMTFIKGHLNGKIEVKQVTK